MNDNETADKRGYNNAKQGFGSRTLYQSRFISHAVSFTPHQPRS
jgi:hypothetical protein